MTGFLRVKNLAEYQHYRERRPPWVKLHQDVLESYPFGLLPDATKYHALGIILLASRLDNRIPNDPKWIAGKIQALSQVNITALIEADFLEQIASDTLASCKQHAMPEREGERETEKRESERQTSADALASRAASEPIPSSENGKDPDRWNHVFAALDDCSYERLRADPTLRKLPWWDAQARAHPDPDLDPVTEIAKMDAWLLANPRHYKRFDRFVSNWLARAERDGS